MTQQTLDEWEWRLLMRDLQLKQRQAVLHENRHVLTSAEYLHQLREITVELQELAKDYIAFNAAADEHYAALEATYVDRSTSASTEPKTAIAAEPPSVPLGTGRDSSGVGGGWLWFMLITALFAALAAVLKAILEAILGHGGPKGPNDSDQGRP